MFADGWANIWYSYVRYTEEEAGWWPMVQRPVRR